MLTLNVKITSPAGVSVTASFDSALVREVADIPNVATAMAQLFDPSCRVPDAWRYQFDVTNGLVSSPLRLSPQKDLVDSRYQDAFAWRAARTDPILLLLESPHVDEFFFTSTGVFKPKGPAQRSQSGGSGYALQTYAGQVLSQLGLPSGSYPLILANPVQYHTSLRWLVTTVTKSTGRRKPVIRKIHPELRNHVWDVLWQLPFVQADFLQRCQSYRPIAVVNCCTQKLQPQVTQFLVDHAVCPALYTCTHPADWCRFFRKNKRSPPLMRV
jgi:hypothetical protein